MKEYFKLQFLMTIRKLSDGSRPIVGYLLALLISLVFVGVSFGCFQANMIMRHIFMFLPRCFFVSKLSEIRRNDFLKICFANRQYRKVRMLENLLITLPFVLFLVYKQHFYLTFILVAITVLMALLNFKATYNIIIPTPFYKKTI